MKSLKQKQLDWNLAGKEYEVYTASRMALRHTIDVKRRKGQERWTSSVDTMVIMMAVVVIDSVQPPRNVTLLQPSIGHFQASEFLLKLQLVACSRWRAGLTCTENSQCKSSSNVGL